MIDSHAHLDRLSDAESALDRAREAGIRGFVLPSVGPDSWKAQQAIAKAHPDVHLAIGIHPWAAAIMNDAERLEALGGLRDQITSSSAVAIGEMGLDHHPSFGPETHSAQEKCFVAQLALATLLELPVVLHVVRAHGRALAILRDMGLPKAGGMVHSFSGSSEVALDYVRLGLHVSFSGSLTKAHHRKSREAAAALPFERLLVETDAPDQLPRDRRAEENEPAFLVDVIHALADLRGVDPLDVAAQTEQNARELFRL